MRKFIFNLLFSSYEKTAIINALWHRSYEDSEQNNKSQNNAIRYTCSKLAKELML